MHSCILNLTIAIGTYLEFLQDGGTFEGGLLEELEWALRDRRPEYTCIDKTKVSVIDKILRDVYTPAMERVLTEESMLLRKAPPAGGPRTWTNKYLP